MINLNKKMLFFIIYSVVFSICFSDTKELPEKITHFINQRFKIDYKKPDRFIWITKNEHYIGLLNHYDSSLANELLEMLWKENNDTTFVDTLFFNMNDPPLNGSFVNFRGDTAWYTIGHYKNGERDSVWISKGLSCTEITSYKNGMFNGLSQTLFPDGTKAYECMLQNGRPVDTVFSWHPNGIIAEFEVYKKGKSTVHKCFNKEGSPIECEGD